MPDIDLSAGFLPNDPNKNVLSDPRVRGFLDTIGASEGADYNTLVGGRKISDLSRHPNIVGLRTSAGPSTAFGKYQITGTTNKTKLAKYASLDYSPENQDLRAVELLRQTGALDALQNDRPDEAVKLAGKEWASLPGSPLPGRKRSLAFATAFTSKPDTSIDLSAGFESPAISESVNQDPQANELAQVGEQSKQLNEPAPVAAPLVRQPSITEAMTKITRNVDRTTAKLERKLPRVGGAAAVSQGQPRANAMSARTPSTWERIKETVEPYVPGLSTLDTPFGPKTDPARGVVSGLTLGAIDPRQVSSEEKIVDPEAQQKADLAFEVGSVVPSIVPYVGAEAALGRVIKGTGIASRVARTAGVFGSVEAAKQGVNVAKGREFDPKAVAESAVLGALTAGLAGENPGVIRRVAAYVSPTVALDVAKGVPAEQAVKSALINAGFALTGGSKAEPETMSSRARLSPEARALVDQARADVGQAINTPTPIERPTIPEAQQSALRASAMQETLSPAVNAPKLDPQLQEVPPVSRIELVTEAPKLNRWQHRDFGLVTESTDQSRVPTGKVRVLDQNGVEHVIQRSKGTGAGNQIAIPIKSEVTFPVIDRRRDFTTPAEAPPAPATPEVAQPVKTEAASIPEAPAKTPSLRREVIPSTPVQKGGPIGATSDQVSTEAKISPASSTAGSGLPALTRERGFSKSAQAAGLPQATDLTYAVNTDIGATDRANARIQEHGVDRVVSDLLKTTEVSKDDIVAGSIAAHQLTEKGDLAGAVDVVNDLARKLTNAGQTTQAASLISRLSPEGVLLAAQKRMKPEQKLNPDQAKMLVDHASRVREAEAKVSLLEQQIEQLKQDSGQAPLTRQGATKRIETLQDRLGKMEQEARARLEERAAAVAAEKATGVEYRHSGIPIDVKALADYAVIGAAKIARKGITLAQWTEEMVKEFGEGIKPHLRSIYAESYKHFDEERKTVLAEREKRGAMKGQPEGLPSQDVQKLINQRAQARKDAQTARAELSRRFNNLTMTKWQRGKSIAGDVINVPRTLKSSVDLSAPRQAAMWMINHPVQGAKVFFGKQLKAMRGVNYDKFADELQSDPDYSLMTRSGLALSTVAHDAPYTLTRREEAFMSKIAGALPGVKQSERAYTTLLDTARASWFRQLAKSAEMKAESEGRSVTPDEHKAIANFVNIATGRGNLGKGWLNDASPFLNAVFFAPKFAASKVQIFDPRVYSSLPKGARLPAMREAATYFGAMASTALLLKYGLNANVGMNPEDSDFMKLTLGKTHYDLANGTGQYITFAARLLKNAENKVHGKKDSFGKSFSENVDRFTRYKYSPILGAARNTWEGKNAIGEKTNTKNEAVQLVAPLFLNDLYTAYKEEGLTGVAKTSPGFVGVGVSTYDQRKPKR